MIIKTFCAISSVIGIAALTLSACASAGPVKRGDQQMSPSETNNRTVSEESRFCLIALNSRKLGTIEIKNLFALNKISLKRHAGDIVITSPIETFAPDGSYQISGGVAHYDGRYEIHDGLVVTYPNSGPDKNVRKRSVLKSDTHGTYYMRSNDQSECDLYEVLISYKG